MPKNEGLLNQVYIHDSWRQSVVGCTMRNWCHVFATRPSMAGTSSSPIAFVILTVAASLCTASAQTQCSITRSPSNYSCSYIVYGPAAAESARGTGVGRRAATTICRQPPSGHRCVCADVYTNCSNAYRNDTNCTQSTPAYSASNLYSGTLSMLNCSSDRLFSDSSRVSERCQCDTDVNGYCYDINECSEGTHGCLPGSQGGHCVNNNGSYSCVCMRGYSGDGASSCNKLDPCNSTSNAPCKSIPFSECHSTQDGYVCACASEYLGSMYNSSGHLQNCTSVRSYECNCSANATCITTQVPYTCSCRSGFSGAGDGVTGCLDIDECTSSGHACAATASCQNAIGHYTCVCNGGYQGNGRTCSDTNECTTKPCHVRARCTNSAGSYSCSCHTGFTGDGRFCINHDECSVGQHNCRMNSSCVDTVGSFHCECDKGYQRPAFTATAECRDIDECSAGSLHSCHADANCSNTAGSFSCRCLVGFTGNGHFCADIDECKTGLHRCSGQATCTDIDGAYNCACSDGYTGNGRQCTNINECYSPVVSAAETSAAAAAARLPAGHDCDRNAECADLMGEYNCTCKPGYYGTGRWCSVIPVTSSWVMPFLFSLATLFALALLLLLVCAVHAGRSAKVRKRKRQSCITAHFNADQGLWVASEDAPPSDQADRSHAHSSNGMASAHGPRDRPAGGTTSSTPAATGNVSESGYIDMEARRKQEQIGNSYENINTLSQQPESDCYQAAPSLLNQTIDQNRSASAVHPINSLQQSPPDWSGCPPTPAAARSQYENIIPASIERRHSRKDGVNDPIFAAQRPLLKPKVTMSPCSDDEYVDMALNPGLASQNHGTEDDVSYVVVAAEDDDCVDYVNPIAGLNLEGGHALDKPHKRQASVKRAKTFQISDTNQAFRGGAFEDVVLARKARDN